MVYGNRDAIFFWCLDHRCDPRVVSTRLRHEGRVQGLPRHAGGAHWTVPLLRGARYCRLAHHPLFGLEQSLLLLVILVLTETKRVTNAYATRNRARGVLDGDVHDATTAAHLRAQPNGDAQP